MKRVMEFVLFWNTYSNVEMLKKAFLVYSLFIF